jgi:RimJ/RimL family protein N-acetyltransferase
MVEMIGDMALVVRSATPDDLDELIDVQEEGAVAGLSNIFPQDRYPFPRDAVRGRWLEELGDPATRVYVAVDRDGAVVGFAATRSNELLHFGTALRTWGAGTAQDLHAAVLDELARAVAAAGGDRLRLRVFEANHRARRFYERLGWAESGERTRSAFPPHAVLVEYQRPVSRQG